MTNDYDGCADLRKADESLLQSIIAQGDGQPIRQLHKIAKGNGTTTPALGQ